jgi:ABC-type transporter Mla MlaB component
LKLGLFQHPNLTRHTFRMPDESLPARVWRRLHGDDETGHRVQVELRSESTVWVSVAGTLSVEGAERLAGDLVNGLRRRKERLVLDLERIVKAEAAALDRLAEHLRAYRDRIRIVLPEAGELATLAMLFAIYR